VLVNDFDVVAGLAGAQRVVPLAFDRCPDLSRLERAVLCSLYGYFRNLPGWTGCFPSQKTIAREIRATRQTVCTALRQLREKGYVDWAARCGTSNVYKFTKKLMSYQPKLSTPDETLRELLDAGGCQILGQKEIESNIILHSADAERKSLVPGGTPRGETDTQELVLVPLKESFADPSVENTPLTRAVVEGEESPELRWQKLQRPMDEFRWSEKRQAAAEEVWGSFTSAMQARGLHHKQALRSWELPQIVAMLRNFKSVDMAKRVIEYSVAHWETLAQTTGSDGRKLYEIPTFNQMIVPWRYKCWSARMLGVKRPKRARVGDSRRPKVSVMAGIKTSSWG
jgi:DNA-binding transcriptional regulator YhcF (GntR family)